MVSDFESNFFSLLSFAWVMPTSCSLIFIFFFSLIFPFITSCMHLIFGRDVFYTFFFFLELKGQETYVVVNGAEGDLGSFPGVLLPRA